MLIKQGDGKVLKVIDAEEMLNLDQNKVAQLFDEPKKDLNKDKNKKEYK